MVDEETDGASMHSHIQSTNSWQPPAKKPTGGGSTGLAGSLGRQGVGLSQSAGSDVAEWGEGGARGKTPTAEGANRRSGTPEEGSMRSSGVNAAPPPIAACTTIGNPERLYDAAAYDNDWVWFALGAVGVAAVMLVGKQFYRSVSGTTTSHRSSSQQAVAA